MSAISAVNWKRLASAFVPGALIAAISIYALGSHAPPSLDLRVLPGKTLAAYDGFYPIRTDDTRTLYLDRELFMKTVNYLSQHPLPRAVADLVYLGNSNNATLLLDGPTKTKYLMLTQQPDYVALPEVDRGKDRIFWSYANIVNGIGQTSADTPVEVVLHDTCNPLCPIVAVQSPIFGHRLGDTNTDFGVQFTKNYSYGEGQGQGRGASFMSHGPTLGDGRAMKSTTISIFHDACGLIRFIYINTGIPRMNEKYPEYTEYFVDTLKTTTANDVANKMIQNSKCKN